MATDAVVVNASPLIALLGIGEERLLPALFGEVYVPRAVLEEVGARGPRTRMPAGSGRSTGCEGPRRAPSQSRYRAGDWAVASSRSSRWPRRSPARGQSWTTWRRGVASDSWVCRSLGPDRSLSWPSDGA